MLRGSTYFRAFATVVLVAASLILIPSLSMALAIEVPSVPNYPTLNFPPCLSKVQDCMEKYFVNTVFNAASEDKPVCCSEWAEVIKGDTKCYCDALASSNTTNSYLPQTDTLIKECNIDGTVDSVCGPGSGTRAPSGATTNWAGPICGLMLLFSGLFLY